jgi:hypothetical protein
MADANMLWLERKRALFQKASLDPLLSVVLERALCYSSFLMP